MDAAVATDGPKSAALNEPQFDHKKEFWDEELVVKLPFSLAVLSCDACQVLQHSPGAEPGAAQLLHSVLNACTGSRSPEASPPSILSRLLGPQLEAEALQTLALGRPWKGTIALSTRSVEGLSPAPLPACKKAYPPCVMVESVDAGLRVPPSVDPPREKSLAQIHSISSEHHSMDPVCLERLATSPDMLVGDHEQESSHSTAMVQSCQADRRASNHDPPKRSKSFNSGQRRASFLCMPEADVDKLLSGSPTEDCHRTRSLLKGISQAHTLERAGSDTPRALTGICRCASEQAFSREMEVARAPSVMSEGPQAQEPKFISTGSAALEDFDGLGAGNEVEHVSPVFLGSHGTGYHDWTSPPKAIEICEDSAACCATVQMPQTSTFDVSISRLPSFGQTEPPPLLVSIYNSSDHGQARFVLSSLAESQLELLTDIMPEHAIQFLAMERREAIPANIAKLAHSHKDATLLFMDLCGFTAFSKSVEPVQVMVLLNNLFSAFDQLTDECHVHKLETAGDCYLVSGSIMAPEPSPNGFATVLAEQQDPAVACKRVMDFAVKALQVASKVTLPGSGSPVSLRVGIHTGDCVSGLIGTKIPKFSCFGDAMNVASRMETTGFPGRIHVSEATYKLLQEGPWAWEPTGGVEVKGKGRMSTYLWSPPPDSSLGLLPAQTVTPQPLPSQYQSIHSACSLLHHVLSPGNSSSPLPRVF